MWADEKPNCQYANYGQPIPTLRCTQPTVDLTNGRAHAVNVKACTETNAFCFQQGLALIGGMPPRHVLWRADLSNAGVYVP